MGQLVRAPTCNFNSAARFLAYNWGMYQMIDEPEEEEFAPRASFALLPFAIGAILAGLVFFVVWLASPGSPSTPGFTVETPASRAAYLEAISAPNPAFRRARLMDYQRVHPDTDRSDAVRDQIAIINAAEQRDWESVTARVYDVRAEAEVKREALAAYESRWNRNILGGRGEELDTLRAEIDETAEAQPLPDRTMEESPSPIPNTIPSDTLAGAPPQIVAFQEQDIQIISSVEALPVVPQPVVVQPSVRRNMSPKYPRSARRKKIGAIVVLSMKIDTRGRVAMTEIIDVQADRYEREFIRAAERAAKRTRFNPKTIDGKPVPASGVRKRYIFQAKP